MRNRIIIILKGIKNFMRIISAVFFTILLNIAPACAEWVNVQDIKEPIRLLDTGSIKKVDYKNNEGAIFALRYMDKNNKFHLNSSGLIAYSHGAYFALGKQAGTFGFSVRKPRN